MKKKQFPLPSKQGHGSFGLLCEDYWENPNNTGLLVTGMGGGQVEWWSQENMHPHPNPQSPCVEPYMEKDVVTSLVRMCLAWLVWWP